MQNFRTLVSASILFLFAISLQAQGRLNIDSISNFKFQNAVYPNTNEVWGHVDSNGTEYALVGRGDGFSVISLADPANPQLVYSDISIRSLWRDIKTWKGYAYVVNESGGGLEIFDLNTLPDSVRKVASYRGDSMPLSRAHNLYIDSNGVAYLYGTNNNAPSSPGTIFLDVDTDPENPIELGNYDSLYLHDGYVRNDILYGAAVYDGTLIVVDVNDKQNPVFLGNVSTPSSFTHNVWLSDDGNTAFTTDEVSGAYIAAYDVTNPSLIQELDRIRTRNTTNIIPHNTHVLNDFLITSYYTAGLSIVDGSNPNILIETGYFDSSPNFSGPTFNGNWGAYPFLPSGLILITDMEEGLFVLQPDYTRASFLELSLRDCNGNAVTGAKIILDNDSIASSNLAGRVEYGALMDGSFDLRIEANGFYPELIEAVSMVPGQTQNLSITLRDSSSRFKLVFTDDQQNPVPNVSYSLVGEGLRYADYSAQNGQADITELPFGNYQLHAGKWGYKNLCIGQTEYSCFSDTDLYLLEEGYEDNFEVDLGWSVSGNEDQGKWMRVKPIGVFDGTTLANPGVDALDNCGDKAFITGNGFGSAQDFDVDSLSVLSSPQIDLAAYVDPYLVFYSWFYNGGLEVEDRMLVSFIDTSGQTISVKNINAENTPMSNWVIQDIRVADFIEPLAFAKLELRVEDVLLENILEAGIDGFFVSEGSFIGLDKIRKPSDYLIYPNPFKDQLVIESANSSYSRYEFYDLSARMLVAGSLQNHKTVVDLQGLPSGVYIIRLMNDAGQFDQQKLIKQ
jgi:choice-of-anchor B domain-containing protein